MKIRKKKQQIIVKGAKIHNLKNINISIPQNKLVVITGVSGSGKSSLAFDTLYAEGQRRYIESLSSYARQFLKRINKPNVDEIKNLPPAIAIDQKSYAHNPRSTVGTSTEVYDYIKLLFAKIGRTYSPISGVEVKSHLISDVTDYILKQKSSELIYILAEVKIPQDRTAEKQLKLLSQQGFSRIMLNGEVKKIRELPEIKSNKILLIIDRVTVTRKDKYLPNRIADSVNTAFYEGKGYCLVYYRNSKKKFSNLFEQDGITFQLPSVDMFSFSNPVGACKKCEGYGEIVGINPDFVIPNKNLSVYEDSVACWRGEKMKKWKQQLINNAQHFNFPIHRPYSKLTTKQKKVLWEGNRYFGGINTFFKIVESQQYKIQNRVLLARYRGKTICPDCKATRLKKEATYVKINEISITELIFLPLYELEKFFKNIKLNKREKKIAERILIEINNRLNYLCNMGLSYLTLNRLTSSLSGGEMQRINLAAALGNNLTGALYVLDEPSIGLHPQDTYRLIKVIKDLRNLGNTVLVVEHDEDIIRSADKIIDIGPLAGDFGGEIVFNGSMKKLLQSDGLTARYLKRKKMVLAENVNNFSKKIEFTGINQYNLRNVSVSFPLNTLTVITGVSGSGKSSLMYNVFYFAMMVKLGRNFSNYGNYREIKGDINEIKNIEYINQNPIGKTSRSNPSTYLKIYDDIRQLYAQQKLSKQLNLRPLHFSFNVDGGRCDECKGEGTIKIDMQFMADINIVCESCRGKRFKEDILMVKYRGKSIYDIIEMRIIEAHDFFKKDNIKLTKRIVKKLEIAIDTGLDYLKLGQSSTTLSGGESQRVKLAYFLTKEKIEPTIFIFDEPTTGLHFHDIHKLLEAFFALIKRGHSLYVIEHNMEVIKAADWIIDLGPEGGEKGGQIVFEGTPKNLINKTDSYTGKFLASKL